jgi:hypothetical protein
VSIVHLSSYQQATAGQHREHALTEAHIQAVRDLTWTISNAAISGAQAAIDAAYLAAADILVIEAGVADATSDDKLTPPEKGAVLDAYRPLYYQRDSLLAQADTYGLTAEKATYLAAYNVFTGWMIGAPVLLGIGINEVAWRGTTTDLGAGGGVTYRGKWKTYLDSRQVLLDAIATKARSLITATEAQLANIASDSVLSKGSEKSVVLATAHDLIDGKGALDTQAAVSPAIDASVYDAKIAALKTYLEVGLGVTTLGSSAAERAWIAVDSNIVYDTFVAKFREAQAARTDLVGAIAQRAKTAAAAAQTTADSAYSIALPSRAVHYSATAPTTRSNGTALLDGDQWFNTDITTACPVSTCGGHALDTAGVPYIGTWAHRAPYWTHVRSGGFWTDGKGTQLICAGEIAAGAVAADKIAANALKTANYAYTGTLGGGTEVATAGAKMQNAPGGTALLVAPSNLKIGNYNFNQMMRGLSGRLVPGPSPEMIIDLIPSEVDTWYSVIATPSAYLGIIPMGAFIVKSVSKNTNNVVFTMYDTPPIGTYIDWDVALLRPPP